MVTEKDLITRPSACIYARECIGDFLSLD